MRNESVLYDYCRRDSFKSAEEFLRSLEREHKSVDIMYKDGLFFRLVLSSKSIDSEKVKILTSLLEYFEKTKPQEEQARLILQSKLSNILEEALRSYEVSDEIDEILKPYIFEDDSDFEQDLSGLEESSTIGSEEMYYHHEDNQNNHHEIGFLGNNGDHVIPTH